MAKKILITGSDGTLGKYLVKNSNHGLILFPTNRSLLDITRESQIKKVFEDLRPDYVIHLAAMTNVDLCEKEKTLANKVNFIATKNIADQCQKIGAQLTFISTSAVFGGYKNGFFEDDARKPINYYGKTKFDAENYIVKNIKEHFIIRAGWLIGGGKLEKKFISYILSDIKKGKKISAVNDKFGTLTSASELSDFIFELLRNKKYGIYHFGSKGVCSRYDIARKIGEFFNKDNLVSPTSHSFFTKSFSAPRPDYEVLKSNKIIFPNTWKKSLTYYINNEF